MPLPLPPGVVALHLVQYDGVNAPVQTDFYLVKAQICGAFVSTQMPPGVNCVVLTSAGQISVSETLAQVVNALN